ncbi:hypothetical protein MA16_Dca013008 [Dendrobium catenatum]|uniref:Uncharacterized protein n=1 Tax=Dendrobium catenatum TaxID=906689 RepID=A0A2I0VUR2_9ASPA|nr:hypothetical protein MA16_Dca013008 [Dendrobium catenatum]
MASIKAERPASSQVPIGLGSKTTESKPKATSPKQARKKTEQKPRAPTKKVQAKVSKPAAKK